MLRSCAGTVVFFALAGCLMVPLVIMMLPKPASGTHFTKGEEIAMLAGWIVVGILLIGGGYWAIVFIVDFFRRQ